MSRVFPRWIDFMGRSTFGRESQFFQDKRLMFLGMALGISVLLFQSVLLMIAFVFLILAVFIADARRYNRKHPRG